MYNQPTKYNKVRYNQQKEAVKMAAKNFALLAIEGLPLFRPF